MFGKLAIGVLGVSSTGVPASEVLLVTPFTGWCAILGVLGIAAVVLWFLRDDSPASTNEPTSYREAA
jgi:hypothetical protein